MDNATLIHPVAVYMFSAIRPGIMVIPFSPREVTHDCNAGPIAELKTRAIANTDISPLRSDARAASDI